VKYASCNLFVQRLKSKLLTAKAAVDDTLALSKSATGIKTALQTLFQVTSAGA
jgi:hypothetical protein